MILLACTPTPDDSALPQTCAARFDGAPPEDGGDIRDITATAIAHYAPRLQDIDLQHAEVSSEDTFFQANFDITTIEDPPLERRYSIQHNPVLFDNPPSRHAVGAILVHELKHILDYTEMDAEDLSAFAAWYLTTDDISEYERQTDEYVLESGCGDGLIAYREWLYTVIPAEDLDEKMKNYYTPDEIRAWMDAQP